MSVTYALLADAPSDSQRVDDLAIKGLAGRHIAYRIQCISDLADEDPGGDVFAGVQQSEPEA